MATLLVAIAMAAAQFFNPSSEPLASIITSVNLALFAPHYLPTFEEIQALRDNQESRSQVLLQQSLTEKQSLPYADSIKSQIQFAVTTKDKEYLQPFKKASNTRTSHLLTVDQVEPLIRTYISPHQTHCQPQFGHALPSPLIYVTVPQAEDLKPNTIGGESSKSAFPRSSSTVTKMTAPWLLSSYEPQFRLPDFSGWLTPIDELISAMLPDASTLQPLADNLVSYNDPFIFFVVIVPILIYLVSCVWHSTLPFLFGTFTWRQLRIVQTLENAFASQWHWFMASISNAVDCIGELYERIVHILHPLHEPMLGLALRENFDVYMAIPFFVYKYHIGFQRRGYIMPICVNVIYALVVTSYLGPCLLRCLQQSPRLGKQIIIWLRDTIVNAAVSLMIFIGTLCHGLFKFLQSLKAFIGRLLHRTIHCPRLLNISISIVIPLALMILFPSPVTAFIVDWIIGCEDVQAARRSYIFIINWIRTRKSVQLAVGSARLYIPMIVATASSLGCVDAALGIRICALFSGVVFVCYHLACKVTFVIIRPAVRCVHDRCTSIVPGFNTHYRGAAQMIQYLYGTMSALVLVSLQNMHFAHQQASMNPTYRIRLVLAIIWIFSLLFSLIYTTTDSTSTTRGLLWSHTAFESYSLPKRSFDFFQGSIDFTIAEYKFFSDFCKRVKSIISAKFQRPAQKFISETISKWTQQTVCRNAIQSIMTTVDLAPYRMLYRQSPFVRISLNDFANAILTKACAGLNLPHHLGVPDCYEAYQMLATRSLWRIPIVVLRTVLPTVSTIQILQDFPNLRKRSVLILVVGLLARPSIDGFLDRLTFGVSVYCLLAVVLWNALPVDVRQAAWESADIILIQKFRRNVQQLTETAINLIEDRLQFQQHVKGVQDDFTNPAPVEAPQPSSLLYQQATSMDNITPDLDVIPDLMQDIPSGLSTPEHQRAESNSSHATLVRGLKQLGNDTEQTNQPEIAYPNSSPPSIESDTESEWFTVTWHAANPQSTNIDTPKPVGSNVPSGNAAPTGGKSAAKKAMGFEALRDLYNANEEVTDETEDEEEDKKKEGQAKLKNRRKKNNNKNKGRK